MQVAVRESRTGSPSFCGVPRLARRLRSQPWLRPADGQPIRPVVDPIPAGPTGEPLLSELILADRE